MTFNLDGGHAVEVKTSPDLSGDQKARVLSKVQAQQVIDLDGCYLDRQGAEHRLAVLHFTDRHPGVDGAFSDICGIDDLTFDQIWIVLEDTQGQRTGWRDATPMTRDLWHYGIVFLDDADRAWFCGRTTHDHDPVGAQEPILCSIRRDLPDVVLRERGSLNDLLTWHGEIDAPAAIEGEFRLTEEEVPRVSEIVWYSEFAFPEQTGEDNPERSRARSEERAVLEGIRTRIRDMGAPEVGPA